MTRLLVSLLLALAVAAPAALAQSNPFGPLPPAAPAETPPPEETGSAADDGKLSRGTLLLVAGGVIFVFGGLAFTIMRDARRSLTEDDRAQLDRAPGEIAHKKSRDAKAKARQRAKRQREARRKSRKR